MSIVIERKWSIGGILFLFGLYILSHIIVGLFAKGSKYELEQNPNDKDIQTKEMVCSLLFKWWAFIYTLFALLILYI